MRTGQGSALEWPGLSFARTRALAQLWPVRRWLLMDAEPARSAAEPTRSSWTCRVVGAHRLRAERPWFLYPQPWLLGLKGSTGSIYPSRCKRFDCSARRPWFLQSAASAESGCGVFLYRLDAPQCLIPG